MVRSRASQPQDTFVGFSHGDENVTRAGKSWSVADRSCITKRIGSPSETLRTSVVVDALTGTNRVVTVRIRPISTAAAYWVHFFMLLQNQA